MEPTGTAKPAVVHKNLTGLQKNAAERASLLGSKHKTRRRLAAGKPRKGDLILEACRFRVEEATIGP